MVDSAHVRQMAMALPEVTDESQGERLAFSVAGKGFAWTWNERTAPKMPRRARPDVLAVRCLLERKEMLVEAAPDAFFDEDHYRGFPAVLVRLDKVEEAELVALMAEGWRLKAPKRLLPRR
jgi:hypothetical protein